MQIDQHLTNEQQFQNVYNTLQNKYNEDDIFRQSIDGLTEFYGRKLIGYAKNEEQEQLVLKGLDDVIKSQFFHGYYLMTAILEDAQTDLPSEIWCKPKGMIRNEIPLMVRSIFAEEGTTWSTTDLGREYGLYVLDVMEPGYEIIKRLREEITLFGAYHAFIEDDRYQEEKSAELKTTMLGNPFDLEFLSPQVFMQAQFQSEQHEIWDIYFWSSQENAWVGTVHLSTLPMGSMTVYLLECSLSNQLIHFEKNDIVDTLVAKLPQDVQNTLQVRVYHSDDLEVFVNKASV